MDWLNFSTNTALWGFFFSSFLAATLLPGGSEAMLFGLLKLHPNQFWPALALGTLGNTLGGMITYACGRGLPHWRLPEETSPPAQIHKRVRQWGTPILVFSWTPIIGDALCLAAGWLRLNPWLSALFMAVGKFARYWLVAQGALPS